jgi:hypothetical protein
METEVAWARNNILKKPIFKRIVLSIFGCSQVGAI